MKIFSSVPLYITVLYCSLLGCNRSDIYSLATFSDPITSIRIEATFPAGAGSNDLTWYIVDSEGKEISQASENTGFNLFTIFDETIPLTTPIHIGNYFLILHQVGSSNIACTFTMLREDGSAIDTLFIAENNSDIITLDSFTAADDCIIFKYDVDGVTYDYLNFTP